MKIELIHWILAFLGFILYLGTSLMKAQKSHGKENFNIKIWFSDNIISLILSLTSIIILMISADEIFKLAVLPKELSSLIKVFSVIFGYFNFSLVKKIFDIYKPKKLRKG